MTVSFVSDQCAAQSLGPANELFGALIQTILSVQCAISSPDNWPTDFGPSAMQHGETSTFLSPSLSHTVFGFTLLNYHKMLVVKNSMNRSAVDYHNLVCDRIVFVCFIFSSSLLKFSLVFY